MANENAAKQKLKVSAVDLAKEQREISVAEFFSKNL